MRRMRAENNGKKLYVLKKKEDETTCWEKNVKPSLALSFKRESK